MQRTKSREHTARLTLSNTEMIRADERGGGLTSSFILLFTEEAQPYIYELVHLIFTEFT